MALAFACSLLSVFPALAGEWRQTEDKEWQYIQDDGTKATGWLEVDGNRYYLDENGILQDENLTTGTRKMAPGTIWTKMV